MTNTKIIYADRPRLEKICQIISPSIEILVDSLNIKYRASNKYLMGRCPIHYGQNNTSWKLYLPDDEYNSCIWQCFSSNCHKQYGSSPFGLTRGVLQFTWREAVDYVIKLYDINIKDIRVDHEKSEQCSFGKKISVINKTKIKSESKMTRAEVRQKLSIPAKFYIERGYSKEILDSYDIGVCYKKNKFMSYRAVVPIYDDEYKYLIGCTGRTIIDNYKEKGLAKWLHSSNFNPKNTLFNWWNCNDLENIIIVESVGNALKLIQEGQKNVVAIFGTTLSDQQQIALECSKIRNVFLALDKNEAGQNGTKIIQEQLSRLFNVYRLPIEYNGFEDIGAMDSNTIQENIRTWRLN